MTIDKTRPPKAQRGTLPAFTPVPRHYNRHDGWTPERQLGFIEALADTGSVKSAAHAVNMTPEGAYQLRRHAQAKQFRHAWEAALALGVQKIEDVAMDRALNGVEVPVYHFGEVVGHRMVYNDYLLMFILRNRAPKRFGADNARGMSAVDNMRLKRLKKAWRTEWQAELCADQPNMEDTRASILSKIAAIERADLRKTSDRTIEAKQLAIAQRHADIASGWKAGLPYAAFEEEVDRLLPGCLAKIKAAWPHHIPDPEEPTDSEADWDEQERENAPLALPGPAG